MRDLGLKGSPLTGRRACSQTQLITGPQDSIWRTVGAPHATVKGCALGLDCCSNSNSVHLALKTILKGENSPTGAPADLSSVLHPGTQAGI